MQFRSRLTLRKEADAAIHDLCVDLKGFGADLCVLFVSHHYGPDFHELVHGVYDSLDCRNLIGCTGESIVGPTAEIENRPAATLWLAKLPDVRVVPFLLDQEDLEALAEADDATWHDRLGVTPDLAPSFIVLPDPYSIDVQSCLTKMDALFPSATIVGGMASGAETRGQNRLFIGNQSLRQGLVGVSLAGAVSISAVVSQGCRPVGDQFVITKARANIIEELGGKPALSVLQQVFENAGSADRNLMRKGVHMGRLLDEHQRDPGLSEFLVRNVGISPDRAIAVGDYVRAGQTVQFHVRDAASANDEMDRVLRAEKESAEREANGALLFTCSGRGRQLFDKPNHDIDLVNEILGDCPTAGFFAQGEIGPVGDTTHIHGFTSSLVLFREP